MSARAAICRSDQGGRRERADAIPTPRLRTRPTGGARLHLCRHHDEHRLDGGHRAGVPDPGEKPHRPGRRRRGADHGRLRRGLGDDEPHLRAGVRQPLRPLRAPASAAGLDVRTGLRLPGDGDGAQHRLAVHRSGDLRDHRFQRLGGRRLRRRRLDAGEPRAQFRPLPGRRQRRDPAGAGAGRLRRRDRPARAVLDRLGPGLRQRALRSLHRAGVAIARAAGAVPLAPRQPDRRGGPADRPQGAARHGDDPLHRPVRRLVVQQRLPVLHPLPLRLGSGADRGAADGAERQRHRDAERRRRLGDARESASGAR